MLALAQAFWRDRRGSALVEIAFAMPIFLVLLTGIVETGMFLMLNQKLQHTAVAISDLTTRDEEINQGTLDDIFLAAPQIMAPFPMQARSRVYVTAAGSDNSGGSTIFWQRSGAGSLTQASGVGLPGETPSLPPDIALRDNETIVVTEVYFEYEPFFFTVIDPVRLRRTAYFRPRIGALQSVN